MRRTPPLADQRLGIKLATRLSPFSAHPRSPLVLQHPPSVAVRMTAACDISSRLNVEAGAEPTIYSVPGGAPDSPIHAAMLLPRSPGINMCSTGDLKLTFILLLMDFEYVYLPPPPNLWPSYTCQQRYREPSQRRPPAKLRAKSYPITTYPLTLAPLPRSFPSLLPYPLSTQ